MSNNTIDLEKVTSTVEISLKRSDPSNTGIKYICIGICFFVLCQCGDSLRSVEAEKVFDIGIDDIKRNIPNLENIQISNAEITDGRRVLTIRGFVDDQLRDRCRIFFKGDSEQITKFSVKLSVPPEFDQEALTKYLFVLFYTTTPLLGGLDIEKPKRIDFSLEWINRLTDAREEDSSALINGVTLKYGNTNVTTSCTASGKNIIWKLVFTPI